jgi:hypothetical protein
MTTGQIITIVVIVLLIASIVAMYFLGKKQQKKQEEAQAQMKAMAQHVSMLVIDKKRMKIKEAGFPAVVLENVPKYLRWTKVCVVKAKVGPKIMSFMCDEKIFPLVPVKKEVKAVISGIYITDVKGMRGPLETPQKKQGFFERMKNKLAK